MSILVDPHGKVTVSLGGRCPLACRHCYTMTPQFVHSPPRDVDDVIRALSLCKTPFNTICVSGDTDCFIDESQGLELLRRLVEHFDDTIMFTTRLVPSDGAIDVLLKLGEICRNRQQLFIPCISVVTLTYPNEVEVPSRVPSGAQRLELMATLAAGGLPCILAMRPSFPFSVVSKAEVNALVNTAAACTTVALGEVFLLDNDGRIARRLRLPAAERAQQGRMTFLDQPSCWTKAVYQESIDYTRDAWATKGTPYFLRSPTAVSLLRARWDFARADLRPGADIVEPEDLYIMP